MQSFLPEPAGIKAGQRIRATSRILWDKGLAFKIIVGEVIPSNGLLRVVAERIRAAAKHLRLSRDDLHRIFSRHSIFEGEGQAANGNDFILVETHHLIHGMIGKGALKLVFPEDLLGEGPQFKEEGPGMVEVVPPLDQGRWTEARQAEEVVKRAMQEFMTGESLSMSLKCQATGAPFAGSEGLVLCATRKFDAATGRYHLGAALQGDEEHTRQDKELIEGMMNEAAALLTQGGRIAYDKIVHAAETNSTLTACLDLQLPTNVVEGHLRTLLQEHPNIIIGDEDMTARLRGLLARKDYAPTHCALAKAAARMQMEHSVLLSPSRENLRNALARLPARGSITPAHYREIINLFFGTGETQQNEDQLYHHREPILRRLSQAMSARSLDDCGEPEVLAFYLQTLLDNQRIMMEDALLKKLSSGQPLPLDWFERAPLLSREQEQRLAALIPSPDITRDKVKESFWEIVNILCEARADTPRYTPDPFLQAKKEVLERAINAVTSAGELLPSAERIAFFTLPLTYECVTPKLGVVTRKPVAVCGSELRPEAMALGGVMSIEILLKRLTGQTHPLRGLTVSIEGLGNAGKHVATTMMHKGAVIVGVSDSRGAIVCRQGFTREELTVIIAHKNSGRRMDTLLSSPSAQGWTTAEGRSIEFLPDPSQLKGIPADILVLAAIPGSLNQDNSPHLQAKVVCELAGAAVTGEAKQVLKERQIHVIPDNLASSGGLLVSLSEMLQNSAGQNWHRKLEEYNLYEQLSKSYEAVMEMALKHEVDAPTASDILALQRMHERAIYRERLERMAGALEEKIRLIRGGERVLLVSDNDEDGVASAAVLLTLMTQIVPKVEAQVSCLNESFRSDAINRVIQKASATAMPVKHLFVLDRAFPVSERGQARLAEAARQCSVTFINNHQLPEELLEGAPPETRPLPGDSIQPPDALGILYISPQALKSTTSAKELSTAMCLRELAHQLITDDTVLARINWQAAVGSYLDIPDEPSSSWLWFSTQFNPDRTLEAARAIRLVTRTGGFQNAVQALAGVTHPDQIGTNPAWGQFMAEYRLLDERVQVLVEKIVLENRRRPLTSHFFSHDEVISPTPVAGNEANELDFYHWISEYLSRRGNLSEKPIIVGQLVRDEAGESCLGVRIRSPRGVDLMEAGLPAAFTTGGLPNTAIARIPLPANASPEAEFHKLVDEIWMKTTSSLYLGSAAEQDTA